MINYSLRLKRLHELAEAHTSESDGREDIEELLDQRTSDPEEVECPRYVAIVEHADERRLYCDDSVAELLATFNELATGDIRERPEAIIDLDTNVRHEAHTTLVITFTPPLPGACEHVARLYGGERSALRLVREVAEENAPDNPELKEALALVDALLNRTFPAPASTGGEQS